MTTRSLTIALALMALAPVAAAQETNDLDEEFEEMFGADDAAFLEEEQDPFTQIETAANNATANAAGNDSEGDDDASDNGVSQEDADTSGNRAGGSADTSKKTPGPALVGTLGVLGAAALFARRRTR